MNATKTQSMLVANDKLQKVAILLSTVFYPWNLFFPYTYFPLSKHTCCDVWSDGVA